MKKTIQLIRTPITYYGGKQKMLPHLLPLVPAHRLYTEAFIGGGALYWAKTPAKVEIINDLDGRVATFYRILKRDCAALQARLEGTLFSRESYCDALHVLARPHLFADLDVAWAFWVGTNMGFASQIGSWGYDRTGARNLEGKLSRFGPHLAKRLQSTQIEANDAVRVIQSRDCTDAFHYIDPPYVGSDCGHYKGYTAKDFCSLLEALTAIKGKFLLSSYPSELLATFTQRCGWQQKTIDCEVVVNRNRPSKPKREVLTWNYALENEILL